MGIERAYRCETGVAMSLDTYSDYILYILFLSIIAQTYIHLYITREFGIGVAVYISSNKQFFYKKFLLFSLLCGF